MNKQLTPAELDMLATPVPLPVMTKREKLMRFAEVARKHPGNFFIFHGLEYMHQVQLDQMWHPGSAFAAAAADPILQQAGLRPGSYGNTMVGEAQRFFELSQHDLHEFSCDCGGVISNGDMADRIESIATRS